MSDGSRTEFEKELEELRHEAEQKDREPFYSRLSDEQKIGIGVAVFIVGGILGLASNPNDPVSGFFVIGSIFAGIAWITITETGILFRRKVSEVIEEMSENQQQQQTQVGTSEKKEKKQICQECGWKNATRNNYCHDCGNELQG